MLTQLFAVFLYVIVLVTIGFCAHKKSFSGKDFALGSRQLNFWVTAISAHADDMSSWLFLAFPMAIFVSGAFKLWVAIGLIGGMFFNWHIVAPRLRLETEKYDSNTLSTYFEKRFNDTSGMIRIMSAIMILFFMTYYLSSGLVATGRLFETLFQIDYYVGISVATLVIISYVMLGGFTSVAWTDFAQGIFLLCMIMLVPIVGFFHLGTASQIVENSNLRSASSSFFPEMTFTSLFSVFSLTFGWGLGYFGQPHILTKFMGIKDPAEMKKAKYLGISWQFLALSASAMVGFVAMGFFPEGIGNPEMVFVEMTRSLFTPFFAALIICGIFAANISTMDAQILVAATVWSEDFYKRILNRNAGENQLLLASRIGVVFFSMLAFGMACGQSDTIISIVEYAWSGLGSAFGPVVLTALYSRYVNRYGAIAGITTGGIVAAIWPTLNPLITSIQIVPLVPGFFLGLAAVYGVSWMSKSAMEIPLQDQAIDVR